MLPARVPIRPEKPPRQHRGEKVMAAPILRIDVAENSRDLQLVALEPGLPMLDRGGVNAGTLFKWLGPLVAEPDFNGDSVRFYVRDVMGGRPEDVECYPATEDDLQGSLRAGLEELQEKIGAVEPENSTEQAIHGIISSRFETLVSDEGEEEREVSFFKYRIGKEPWRLVWCWGYQRRDQTPAPAMICTDPACKLLFLRLPGHNAQCPGCSEFSAILVRKRSKWPLRVAALALLLLMCLGLWWLNWPKLIITPGNIAARAGTTQHFTVERSRLIWSLFFGNEDVTNEIVAFSYTPSVVEVENQGASARLISKGQALVRFHLVRDDLSDEVVINVSPPENPLKLYLDPDELISLAVDSTYAPKIMGEWADGEKAELSDSIVWEKNRDGIVRIYNDKLQGKAEGETTLVAKYRASPDNEYITLDVDVKVTPQQYLAITATLDPAELVVGQSGRITVLGEIEGGEELSLSDSSAVEFEISPTGAARIDENGYLVGLEQTDEGKLTVTYGELATTVDFSVGAGSLFAELVVAPSELSMYVGEKTDLVINGPGSDEPTIVSADPSIVEVFGESKLIVGRGAGTTTLTVTKGGESVEVTVTVAGDVLELVTSLAIVPDQITVQAGGYRSFVVVGYIGDRSVDIAADRLDWQQIPSPILAEVDKALMTVNGKATSGDIRQKLVIGVTGREDLLAEADVAVIASGKLSGLELLLAGDPFRDAPPFSLVPQTVMIGNHKLVVQGVPGRGQFRIVTGLDEMPFDIRKDDIVTGINGVTVRNADELRRQFAIIRRGTVGGDISIIRNGVPMTLGVIGGESPFASVSLDGPYFDDAGGFTVNAVVVSNRKAGGLQYQVYEEGGQPTDEWIDAQPGADGLLAASVPSAAIRRGPKNTRYALIIASRDPASGAVQAHRYGFSLDTKIRKEEGDNKTSPEPDGIPGVDVPAPDGIPGVDVPATDAPVFDAPEDAPDAPKFDP
jgi:hypothetical protein